MIAFYSDINKGFTRYLHQFIDKLTSMPISSITSITSMTMTMTMTMTSNDEKKLTNKDFLKKLSLLVMEMDFPSKLTVTLIPEIEKLYPKLTVLIVAPQDSSLIYGQSHHQKGNTHYFPQPFDELLFYQKLRQTIPLDLYDRELQKGVVKPFISQIKPKNLYLVIDAPILEINENQITMLCSGSLTKNTTTTLYSDLFKFKGNTSPSIKIRIDEVIKRNKQEAKEDPLKSNHHLSTEKFPHILSCSIVYNSFEEKMTVRRWIYSQ